MREILFRGKSVDNGEWVEGYPFVCWDRAYILWSMEGDHPRKDEVILETVRQYTGLTDRHGTKIFEGDIIEYDKDGARYEVIFAVENGIAKFCSKDLIDGNLGYINQCRDKIIGNIHDNPELLEETKQ